MDLVGLIVTIIFVLLLLAALLLPQIQERRRGE